MDWNKLQENRLAVMAYLVSKATARTLGRTALMKFCYFLQVVKGVPLGYRFTMYSYGPFDSDVLSDLGTAVNLQGITSRIEYNSVGYGYRLEKGDRIEQLEQTSASFLEQHRGSLNWVLEEFGDQSSSDLELESTIVFMDREATRSGKTLAIPDLAQRVRQVKPHFLEKYVIEKVKILKGKDLLGAVK
jgi:uncharacterized protein